MAFVNIWTQEMATLRGVLVAAWDLVDVTIMFPGDEDPAGKGVSYAVITLLPISDITTPGPPKLTEATAYLNIEFFDIRSGQGFGTSTRVADKMDQIFTVATLDQYVFFASERPVFQGSDGMYSKTNQQIRFTHFIVRN